MLAPAAPRVWTVTLPPDRPLLPVEEIPFRLMLPAAVRLTSPPLLLPVEFVEIDIEGVTICPLPVGTNEPPDWLATRVMVRSGACREAPPTVSVMLPPASISKPAPGPAALFCRDAPPSATSAWYEAILAPVGALSWMVVGPAPKPTEPLGPVPPIVMPLALMTTPVAMRTLAPVIAMVPAVPAVSAALTIKLLPATTGMRESSVIGAPAGRVPAAVVSIGALRLRTPLLGAGAGTPASPARSTTAPPRVVMLPFTFREAPACAVKPTPPVPMTIGASKLMSCFACRITLLPAVLISATSIVTRVPGSANWSTSMSPGAGAGVGAGDGDGPTVMLFGSSSNVPALPFGARVSTTERNCKVFLPDTSTNPPSPLWAPPRALMLPALRVWSSAQTMMRPPPPSTVASALSVAPASTNVRCALGTSGLLPWKSPPTRMLPPPRSPLASSAAPSSSPTRWPNTSIRPPTPACPAARTVPETRASPPAACSSTRPPSVVTERASIAPLCFRVPAKMPTASPRSVPRLTARSPGAWNAMWMPSSPRPVISTCRPAPSTTAPSGLSIRALAAVSRVGDSSTTSPRRASTRPPTLRLPAAELSPKRWRPEIASASLMRSVEAVKPAVSTTAPAPTVMPAGLTSTSRPLEPSVPKIALGSEPMTRLIDVLVTVGCANQVLLPAGMEKLCQLMAEWLVPAPFCVVTVSRDPFCVRVALPTTAWAPIGCACAGAPAAKQAASASAIDSGR